MMYIEKAIEDENTGADVKYHEITAISIDYKNAYSSVTVESYVSKRAKELGKSAIGQPVTFSINAIPTEGAETLAWFYNELIKPMPEDYTPPAEEERGYGYVDPYLYTMGKLKEL